MARAWPIWPPAASAVAFVDCAALRAACARREATALRAALKKGAEVGVAAPDDADAVAAQALLGSLRWEAGALDDLRAAVDARDEARTVTPKDQQFSQNQVSSVKTLVFRSKTRFSGHETRFPDQRAQIRTLCYDPWGSANACRGSSSFSTPRR